MSQPFPLIHSLGLEVDYRPKPGSGMFYEHVVDAPTLENILSAGIKLYGAPGRHHNSFQVSGWVESERNTDGMLAVPSSFVSDTHSGLLINIRPIPKDCKHEPDGQDWEVRNGKWTGPCLHCRETLIAEWKVKE